MSKTKTVFIILAEEIINHIANRAQPNAVGFSQSDASAQWRLASDFQSRI